MQTQPVKSGTMQEIDHAKQQAASQLASVRGLVAAWTKAAEVSDTEEAEQAIHEDALSIECRSGWYQAGSLDTAAPEEYRIILCTGGPHVEIRGALNQYNEPDTAELFYQDWFTGLAEYKTTSEEQDDLVTYAGRFYFGEA